MKRRRSGRDRSEGDKSSSRRRGRRHFESEASLVTINEERDAGERSRGGSKVTLRRRRRKRRSGAEEEEQEEAGTETGRGGTRRIKASQSLKKRIHRLRTHGTFTFMTTV